MKKEKEMLVLLSHLQLQDLRAQYVIVLIKMGKTFHLWAGDMSVSIDGNVLCQKALSI